MHWGNGTPNATRLCTAFPAVLHAQQLSQSASDMHALSFQNRQQSCPYCRHNCQVAMNNAFVDVTHLHSAASYGPFMPNDAPWVLSIVRLLSIEHCTSVRRQQTALQGHLVLLGQYTCHVQNGFKAYITGNSTPNPTCLCTARITCCAECIDTVTIGFWYACITYRVQNHLVVYHHTQQHLGEQHKYEWSATFTCSAACTATVTIIYDLCIHHMQSTLGQKLDPDWTARFLSAPKSDICNWVALPCKATY